MAQTHHTGSELELFEGDQSKLYSGVLMHHEDINSSESKAKVRKLIVVTAILSIVTIVEVTVGLILFKSNPDISKIAIHLGIIAFFVILTMVKAKYIVSVFMHLGAETKHFKAIILVPAFVLMGWLITALLTDSAYHLAISDTFGFTVKSILGTHLPYYK
ncbi:MAG TPA: cytochrome C oxidase subunit IV family protein [Edaphocola sp.]|nr:cytochrome C oxidase subunit IV family protein [Edaphocola sp.]